MEDKEMVMRVVAMVCAAVLLVACGEDPAVTPPAEDPGEAGETEETEEPEETEETEETEVLEGTLGGDPQLEGGCAWLTTDEGRFQVLYPSPYEIAFEPLRLLGPDGNTVAAEGETVTVRGTEAGDMVSVCQVGTLFQATDVLPGT